MFRHPYLLGHHPVEVLHAHLGADGHVHFLKDPVNGLYGLFIGTMGPLSTGFQYAILKVS